MDAVDGKREQHLASRARPVSSYTNAALFVVALAIVYGLVAWASLSTLRSASNIAIFWPAAGLAAGLAIGLGRAYYAPIAVATFIGSVAANLAHGRHFWMSVDFSVLNSAEALLVALLYDLTPRRERASHRLLRVLAFFLAALGSTIVTGFGAALLISSDGRGLPHLLDLWRTWTLSAFVGIAVIAPFVMTGTDLARAPGLIRRHDWRPEIAAIAAFILVAYHSLGLRIDAGPAMALSPAIIMAPLLIWLAGRAQPIAATLSVVLVAVLMAYFAAMGVGRFGDARMPADSRILAAQIALTLASAATQMIIALYAERRLAEMRLRARERQLAAIAETAPGVVFSLETKPDRSIVFPFVSPTSQQVLKTPAHELVADANILLDGLAPKDREALVAALRTSAARADMLSLEVPLERFGIGETWIEIKASPVRDDEHSRVVWHGFIQDVTMRHRIMEEMSHRASNMLAVVQAVAEHTARSTAPEHISDVLTERLNGLVASHALLAASGWEGTDLKRLAEAQLAHLADLFGNRLSMSGPGVSLSPQASQVIGMAIHELATNACKHGALSCEGGSVDLSWRLLENDPEHALEIVWLEQGGVPLPEDRRDGFGRKVIVEVPAYQLRARVDLRRRVDGLMWRIVAPANCLAYVN